MKRLVTKTLAPISAVVAVLALAVPGVQAQTTPVFEYNFPASWSAGTAVTDQSPAGNNGNIDGTLTLSAAVPPGAAAGTQSITTSAGGIVTDASSLLNNATLAASGGFTYDVAFMWDGTASTFNTQKIIDYAGTESLQLGNISAGSAALEMTFSDNDPVNPVSTTVLSTDISPDTWYHVSLIFDTQGNGVDGTGALSGIASMYVDGILVDSAAATKGTGGDNINGGRPIGVGELGSNFGFLVPFNGQIYDPSVSLGVAPVPEPSTIALGLMGGLAFLGAAARRRFKK